MKKEKERISGNLGSDVAEALGLPEYTFAYTLSWNAEDRVTTVTAEYYVSLQPNAKGNLLTELAQYRLEKK